MKSANVVRTPATVNRPRLHPAACRTSLLFARHLLVKAGVVTVIYKTVRNKTQNLTQLNVLPETLERRQNGALSLEHPLRVPRRVALPLSRLPCTILRKRLVYPLQQVLLTLPGLTLTKLVLTFANGLVNVLDRFTSKRWNGMTPLTNIVRGKFLLLIGLHL